MADNTKNVQLRIGVDTSEATKSLEQTTKKTEETAKATHQLSLEYKGLMSSFSDFTTEAQTLANNLGLSLTKVSGKNIIDKQGLIDTHGKLVIIGNDLDKITSFYQKLNDLSFKQGSYLGSGTVSTKPLEDSKKALDEFALVERKLQETRKKEKEKEISDAIALDNQKTTRAIELAKMETAALAEETAKRIAIKRQESKSTFTQQGEDNLKELQAYFAEINRRAKASSDYISSLRTRMSFESSNIVEQQRIKNAKELDKLKEKQLATEQGIVQQFINANISYIQMQSQLKKAIGEQAAEEEKLLIKLDAKLAKRTEELRLITLAKNLEEAASRVSAYGYSMAGKADSRPIGASAYTGTAGLGGKTATQLQQEQLVQEEFEKAFNARMYALGLKTAADRKETLDKEVADARETNSRLEQAERDRLASLQKFRDAANAMYSKVTSGQDNRLLIAKIRNDVKEEEVARIEANNKLVALKRRLRRELDIIDANVDATIITGAEGKLQAQAKVNQYKVLIDQVKKLLQDLEVAGAKTSNVTGIQQGVINEFNQRQQLLDKYSKLEVAKRQKLVDDLVKLEEYKNRALEVIAKRATTGSGRSDDWIRTQSKQALQNYEDNRKALLETANAADTAKSKHIDLSQFILKSMLIWRTYNLVLNETKQLLFAVPRIGMELESTRSILNATMGGVAGTSIALTGLHKEAERTGISVAALRETWRTFSASTTIAGESINTSWKIFSNMNTVITALHYNADRTQHIFLALAQIFNKGKVQSEELVKQLGNLLPGAFAAFAAANNKTTMQLSLDMKKGLVLAHDTILNFTEFYKERFKVSFATARLSLNSELGRMNTAFTELGETLYGLSEKGLKEVTKSLASFANGLKEVLRDKDTWVTLSKTFEAAYWTSSAVALTMFAGKLEALGGIAAASTLAMMKVQNAIAAIAAFAKSPLGIAIAVGVSLWYAKEKIAGDGGKPVADAMINDIEELIKEIKAKDLSIPIDLKINEDSKVLAGRARQTYLNDQQRLVQEDLAYIKSSKVRTYARGAIDSDGAMATERLVAQAAGQLNFPRMSLQGLEDYNEKLKKELGNNVKILNDYKTELKKADLDKANKEASELSVKTQESMEKMRLAAMEEGAEKVKKQFEMQNSDDIANIKKNFSDASKAFEVANRDYQKLVIKARQGTGDLLKLSSVGGKDSKIDETVLAYKNAQEKLDEATRALSDTYEARDKLVEKYTTKTLKTESDFEDKRLALAKKASEDMLKLIDSEASKRMNAVDNELKALEQTKDITSTSAYYNAERALIEKQIEIKKELLKTTKELIGAQQASASTSISGNKLMGGVFNAFSAAGLSEAQAKAITAEVGRENSFQSSIVFGSHVDPYNKATNVGMLSWQKERGKQVAEYLQKYGAMQDGKISQSQESLDLMAKFAVEEMTKSNAGKMFLANKDIGEEDAAKLMGKFIGWRRDDPKYAQGKQTVKDYYAQLSGNISGEGIDSAATELSKVASIEKEIADLEAKKKLTYDQQTASLKTVEEAYAKVTAQYNILTGNIEEGVEQKSAIKYKDALDAVNNALENGNEFEKQRAIFIKWQIEQIDIRTAAQLNYNLAIRATEKELAAIDAQLKQNQALAQIGVRGSLTEMMTNDVINRGKVGTKQKQLGIEEARLAGMLPTDANYDKTVEQIRAIKDELETLAYTSESTMLTISRSIGDSFDKTFRSVADGSLKAKDIFKSFGTSVIKTIQDIIFSELKSGIIRSVFGVLTGGASNLFMGKNSPLSLAFGWSSGVTKSEMGNVLRFSKGGIPDIGNNMQYFPLANGGVGSLRENGKYEAIVPLSRDSSGQLGIKADGGLAPSQNNVYNINVNVSGATDKSNANDVGTKVAAALMVQIADARIANANKLGNQLKPLTAFG